MSIVSLIDVRKGKKSARRAEQVLGKVSSVRNRCGVTKMDGVREKTMEGSDGK